MNRRGSSLTKAVAHYFKGKTLDTLECHDTLATTLGLPHLYEMSDLAREVAAQGLLPIELPPGYPITQQSRLSFYLNPAVVGQRAAEENLKRHLQFHYQSLRSFSHPIPHFRTFCSLLQVSPKPEYLVSKLQTLGWFDPAFRSYIQGEYLRPTATTFSRRWPDEAKKKLEGVAVGSRIEVKASQMMHYLLSVGIEQLIGVILSFKYPQQKLIPNFCLDADPGTGFFGRRVNFKIGEELIAIDLTRSADEAHQKAIAHWSLLDGADRGDYRMVTLSEHRSYSFAVRLFKDEVRALSIQLEAHALLRLLLKLHQEEQKEALRALGDALYCILDKANSLTGDSRRRYLRSNLHILLTNDWDKSSEELQELTPRHYSPLESHFLHNGKMHRVFITPNALALEDPHLYDIVYYLNTLEFQDPLVRDIALLLQLSNEVSSRSLERIAKVNAVEPLFPLLDGRKLRVVHKREEQTKEVGEVRVSDIDELPEAVSFLPGFFEFGKAFIASV